MALSFTQDPVDTTGNLVPVLTNWTPVIGYMLWRNTSIAALFYYRLVLEVKIDNSSGTLIAKMKQRRNGNSFDITNNYARALFNLKDIVNSQIVNTEFDSNYTTTPKRKPIHTVGKNTTTKPFSRSGDDIIEKPQLIKIYVKGYENYSASASASPADVTTDSINDTRYWLAASFPLEYPRYDGSAYIQSSAFEDYTQSYHTDKFLSDIARYYDSNLNINEYINYVQSGDYHTLAFINDTVNFASDVEFIEIAYYDSSKSLIGSKQYIENNSTNGGLTPGSGSHTEYTRLLYFGAGPGNLEASTVTPSGGSAGDAQPSNFANWAYYTIRATSTATPTGDGNYKTRTYYFIKQDGSCKGFAIRRLAWINTKGGWDYFNFKMKSKRTLDISRNNYSTVLGIFNGEKYSYENTARGSRTRQVTAIQKEIIQTDWISEEEGQLLENLFLSSNVNIIENSDTTYSYPVLITDKNFIKKSVANDGVKIRYTINIEYANPVNTNS